MVVNSTVCHIYTHDTRMFGDEPVYISCINCGIYKENSSSIFF
jgi:hypothetical protein